MYLRGKDKKYKQFSKMHLSASKSKGLTTLELQAQNMVNENDSGDDDVYCNDAERYEALVESNKNRRAVSNKVKSFLRQSDI